MMIIKKDILISTSHLFPDVRVREDSASLARLHKKVEEGKSLLFADCCLGGAGGGATGDKEEMVEMYFYFFLVEI